MRVGSDRESLFDVMIDSVYFIDEVIAERVNE